MLHKAWVALFFGIFLMACSKPTKKQQAPLNTGYRLYQKALAYKKRCRYDSAYISLNNALRYTNHKSKDLVTAKIYTQLGVLDYKNHNYAASEADCVKALKILPQHQDKQRAYIYSLLASVSKAKNHKSKFLFYNNLFYQIVKQQTDTLKAFIKYHNNAGNFFIRNKEYDTALRHFNIVVKEKKLAQKYPIRYARVLKNKTRLLIISKQQKEALKLLQKVEKIDVDQHNAEGLLNTYLLYIFYYLQTSDTLVAQKYAQKALKIAKDKQLITLFPNIYEKLNKTDPHNSQKYFEEYVKLQDSMLKQERLLNDRSALVRYETSQKEQMIREQKLKIKNQKKVIILGSTLIFLVLGGATVFYRQKKKIKQQYNDLKQQDAKIRTQHQKLQQQHETITALHKEIHHRIENNLRIISGIINQIKREFKNDKLTEHLSNLQDKIAIINKIHKYIYSKDNFKSINFKTYVDHLIDYFKQLYQAKDICFDNKISEDIQLNFKTTLPLAIIIFEFLTNSYKYAFKNQTDKQIIIQMTQTSGGRYVLLLKDNGSGRASKKINDSQGFGLNLIDNLTRQLGGTKIFQNNKGFEIKITF